MDNQKYFHKKLLSLSFFAFFTVQVSFAQKVVHYDLYVKDTLVNYAGKEKRAIAVNGQIPMPTLEFTEGDTAEIVLHNQLKESTSLHWHGLFLPNKEDGVPYLTQMPIEPGTTYTYRFPIIQTGTHWYHSHSGLQEQIGMYGSFIMHKKAGDKSFRKGIDDLPELPIVLSEWTNLNPNNVHRMLHAANDWFAIQKGATQSYTEAIRSGNFKTKVKNEWKRMTAMDVSDVYYDKVLMNGQHISELKSAGGKQLKAGDKVRLRISNGGASSYFWLRYAGGPMTVVASDGNDVVPVEVDRLIIAVSETYDVVVTIPADGVAYEFMATTEDRTQSTSYFIGNGIKQLISPLPRLKYFDGMKMMNDMMKMNGDLDDMGMNMSWNQMDMNVVMYPEITGDAANDRNKELEGDPNRYNANALGTIKTLNYAMLESPSNTKLPADAPVQDIKFTLTGNMSRYVWSMDNRVLTESDKIPVKKGEILRITLYNNSMMRHPIHLHGFDFRLLNGKGDKAPMKNIIDIMPMETDTIEFEANTEGDWFFHCHILYHMMAGMNRVFAVGDYKNPELPDKAMAYKMLQRESNMPHFMAQNDFASNGNDGEAMLMNARWNLGTEWRLGYNDMHGYEVETHLGRFIGKMQWLMPFVGFDWRYRKMGMDEHEKNIFGQKNEKDTRRAVSLGVMATLPMLVNFQAEVYHDGIVRLSLMREDIPISKRLRGDFMVNTDFEYMAGLRYVITRNIGIRTHYDSDMGFGVGLSLNY
ncbi:MULTISPECIES: multicopper oxidase domain-containing protein [unclassified Arcicella]|jgi:CopA family copper-resistance protein|nr:MULTISPECIES: multicopper oxidase domain-containing protein [unclassified Arcicella]MCA6439190.1 multicopper oxidase domain-containing protein [Chitinophagaceae bacterium]MCA6446966.1 multicopper oxidase domain-containing protein [Chitinophagaceae bacterium]MDR6561523.1 CopA family copper-resistance protein [Arcicella sp. BE51]MDR6811407.1 CopA family copper-resistance protein [Arcicella sp. BE140]MDR6822757.1 CopA family copper-resistance protein [Arcicella sp. BE139]